MTSPQPRVGKVASFLKTQQEYPPEETQRASIAKKKKKAQSEMTHTLPPLLAVQWTQ